MAIVRIQLSFDLEAADIFDKGAAAGLEAKQLNEVLAGVNALKAWRPELEVTHGSLRAIVSRSNPDDPPDLIFEFDSKSLTVEVTDINPHPYGQAQAIHREEMPNAFVSLPALFNSESNENENQAGNGRNGSVGIAASARAVESGPVKGMGSACRIEGDLNGSGPGARQTGREEFEKEGEISERALRNALKDRDEALRELAKAARPVSPVAPVINILRFIFEEARR